MDSIAAIVAAISWPHIVLIIALVCIVLFKSENYLMGYYQSVRTNFTGLQDWDLSRYLSFLFSHSLITVANNNYCITNKGIEYLTWVTRTGKTEKKYF